MASAAWRLFVENGYAGTAMQDVAVACRMSKRTVYRLFPGKPELFAAVVALHRATMMALPGDHDDLPLEDALARIFVLDADPETERARSGLMSVVIVESRQFPELRPLLHEFGGEPSRRLLVEWLQRQADLGRIVLHDADVAAQMLLDVVFGAVSLNDGATPSLPGNVDRPAYLRACFSMICRDWPCDRPVEAQASRCLAGNAIVEAGHGPVRAPRVSWRQRSPSIACRIWARVSSIRRRRAELPVSV